MRYCHIRGEAQTDEHELAGSSAGARAANRRFPTYVHLHSVHAPRGV